MATFNAQNYISNPLRLTYDHNTKKIKFYFGSQSVLSYHFNRGSDPDEIECGYLPYRDAQLRFYFVALEANSNYPNPPTHIWKLKKIDSENFIEDPNDTGVIILNEYTTRTNSESLPLNITPDDIGISEISLSEWYDKMGDKTNVALLTIPVIEDRTDPGNQLKYQIRILPEYAISRLSGFCNYGVTLNSHYYTSIYSGISLPRPIETPLLDYSFDCDENNNLNNKVTITNYDDNQYLDYTLLKLNEVTGIYEYYQDIISNEFYIPIEELGSKFKVRADNDGAFADGFSEVIEFGININASIIPSSFPNLNFNLNLSNNCFTFDSINYYLDGVFIGNSNDGNLLSSLPNPFDVFTVTGEVIVNGNVIFNLNSTDITWGLSLDTYKPKFTAGINYSLYPTLAYDASITNTEVDFNSVNWYLDGVYVGNSIGANFSGILANTNTDYVLTAEFVFDNFTLMSDQSITLRYVEGLNEGNFNLSINTVGCTSISFNIANTIPSISYNTLKLQVSIDDEWIDVGTPTKTATSISVNYNPLLEYNSMYMFRLIAYSNDGFRYSNYVEVETVDITYYISSISGLQPSTQGKWMYEITSFGSACFPNTPSNFRLRFRLQGQTTWNEKTIYNLNTYNGLKRAIYRLTGSDLLRRGETYEVQARFYNTTFGEVLSEIETITTPDIEFPSNVRHSSPSFFNQYVYWDLINDDYYYNCKVYIQVDGVGDLLVSNYVYLNYTSFNITGLKPNTEYTWRFKIVHSNAYHNTDRTYYSNEYSFKTKKLPKHLCEYDVKVVNANCNSSNGAIYINGEDGYYSSEYAQLFDVNLQYFDYNTNTIINKSTGNFYFSNLESGYYHLTITPKPIVWYYYGREGCVKEWIKLENNASTVGVNSVTSKPAICSGFDNQPGRLQVQLDGVSPYYKYWFFNTDGLLIKNGTTNNSYIVLNNATECYYGVIEDSNGCRYLIDEVCIPTETSSSISGIKQLFIAPVTGDIDFNYYNTEDDDYYLDGEDNSFFMSTKISRINTNLTWYKIPIHNGQVSFKQELTKNRQGFIFSDVMEVGIAHQTQEKLNTLLRKLLNKFIVVFQDNNGNWWISGYTSHASIDTVVLTTGRRYDSNQYTLKITSNSADNIITNIDEEWVKNNILN